MEFLSISFSIFNTDFVDKNGKILTLRQRKKKIDNTIEQIQEDYGIEKELATNQNLEVQKLPKFNSDWRKKCNINPFKYANEVEREKLIKQWGSDSNQTHAKIISILEDFLHQNPQLKLEDAILKFENANKISTLKEYSEKTGISEDKT